MTTTVTGGDALTAAEHAELCDRLLVPSLAADELDDRDAFRPGVAGGGSEVLPSAGRTAGWSPPGVREVQPARATRLLTHLAADAAARGTGAGSVPSPDPTAGAERR